MARGRRAVAVAHLPLAHGRLRLRRGRLLRRRPALRRPRDLRRPARRRARARHPRAAGLGPQPHLRPAPVVRRQPRVARLAQARLVPLARRHAGPPAQQLAGGLRRRPRVDLGRAHRAVVPAHVPAPAARPQLGQRRGRRVDARRPALLAGPRCRRLPRRRGAPHRQGPRAAGHPGDRHRRQPPRRRRHTRLPGHARAAARAPRRARRIPRRPHDGRRGQPHEDRADRAVPRRQRRAAPRLRLRVARRCRGRPARGARASRTSRRSWASAGRPGSSPTTTSRACARDWAARRRARRAAVLMLLTLRGTPFLFAGEELGLEDAHVPAERVVDPGGRDGCRAPIPWTTAPDHGWPADPWLPWPPEPGARSVEAAARRSRLRAAPGARRPGAAPRLARPAPRRLELLDDAPDGVLAYERSAGDDRRRVWVNFAPARVALPEDWVVELATADAGDGLPPDAAAVLRPRKLGAAQGIREDSATRRAAPRPLRHPPGRTTRSPARPR